MDSDPESDDLLDDILDCHVFLQTMVGIQGEKED